MTLGEVCEHGSLKRQCLVCELTGERDDLKLRLSQLEKEYVNIHDAVRERDELRIDCMRLQQEINCLRMEPCQLPKCVDERDAANAVAMGAEARNAKLEAEISHLRGELSSQLHQFVENQDEWIAGRDHWYLLAMKAKEALEKLSKEDYCGHSCSDCCVDSANEIAKAAIAAYSGKGDGNV